MSYDNRKALPNGYVLTFLAETKTDKDTIIETPCKAIIAKELGRGGSCIVYEAELDNSVGDVPAKMRVIIKEFYPNNDGIVRNDNMELSVDEKAKGRFEWALGNFQNGQANHISFSNKNADHALPPPFCSGRAHGTFYVVSQYGVGETLSDVDLRGYEIVDALEITASICDAIYAVHQGLDDVYNTKECQLYLDCKPSNIFVNSGNNGGCQVFLFDFNTVQIKGNLSFCSYSEGWSAPEQEFNATETGYKNKNLIGYHTDIFSIAAVLFWMLTGESPKDYLEMIQSSTFDWRKRIIIKDSTNAKYDKQFIFELDRVMKKALQPNPERRKDMFWGNDSAISLKSDILHLLGLSGKETLSKDYIIERLNQHYEKQYGRNGNYAINELRGELFPAIKDLESDEIYNGDNDSKASLIKYYNAVSHNKHIMITGEGGRGKTVSLLKLCKYLLDENIFVIYIPLSKIDADCPLDQYLQRNVCGGEDELWTAIKRHMSFQYADTPNVVLLLDGINEITPSYYSRFIRVLEEDYINSFNGVRIVATSRWYDNETMYRLRDKINLLEILPLDSESVERYLKRMNLPCVSDTRLLSIIQTPLMLTLYAEAESHKEKYKHIKGIELEENPNTAGKILNNYFATQLYRAAEEDSFDKTAHLVLLEFLLPELAYKMLDSQNMYISSRDIRSSIKGLKRSLKVIDDNEGDRFSWYYDDRLWEIVKGECQFDVDSLLKLAVSSLHFLNGTDSVYDFLHPSFRDYFAAYYVANEIKAFAQDTSRIDEVNESIIEKRIFSPEIIQFISDILHEENAQPQFSQQGWLFPGKVSRSTSEYSLAEKLLAQWRNEESEFAQNAVANLFNIMKIGRQENLAWCDFSCLDLRKCWLNNCRFTEWYQSEYYSSTFDGSWINRANFLTDGHESNISAVTSDGVNYIFSGDDSGTVKVYDIDSHKWCIALQLQSRKVIDLAWNSKTHILAILYKNVIFCYSLDEKKVVTFLGNESNSNSFRYVKFNDSGELNYTFDLEPLIWHTPNGEIVPSDLTYDVPSGCAKWNPCKKEIIRSNLRRLLSVYRYDEDTMTWEMHPVLQEKLNNLNKTRKEKKKAPFSLTFISLRELGAEENTGVNCIEYNADGSKVLIAIQKNLIEFETDHFTVTRIKKFSQNVGCACYTHNGNICVGIGSSIVFLDTNFSEILSLKGSQLEFLSMVCEDVGGEGYYLLSMNGEIKKVNHQLVVQNMRKITNTSRFMWVRDRLTNKTQMTFLPNEDYKYGTRYSYESDYTEPLGWRYEFIDLPLLDVEDEQRSYNMGTQLMVVETIPPYKKIFFKNYSGIWIFGCSFIGIKGDIQEKNSLKLLIQNGGFVDADSE